MYPAWIVTCLNVCKGLARRSSLDTPTVPNNSYETDATSDARADLVTALKTLPIRQRQTIVLHDVADYPVATVAESPGVSQGAVKSH